MIMQAVHLINLEELILDEHNLCSNIEQFESEVKVLYLGYSLRKWLN